MCRSGRPSTAGSGRSGRASDQRTSPSGSSAASSFARATTTNRPNGDHEASRQSPRRRFEPSAWTTQTPSADSTSKRPGAGSEKSAGCARSMPTASRIESSTACPGGLATAPATTATAASTRTGRHDLALARCGRALLVRRAHDLPRALLCALRRRNRVELHGSVSCSWSRPRRSREFTVPRGRSSRRAISPGV